MTLLEPSYPRMVAGDLGSAAVCARVIELRAKAHGMNLFQERRFHE